MGVKGAYDTGLGTTPGMWEMVSEELDGCKLPVSVNKAIEALCKDEAQVDLKKEAGPWR